MWVVFSCCFLLHGYRPLLVIAGPIVQAPCFGKDKSQSQQSSSPKDQLYTDVSMFDIKYGSLMGPVFFFFFFSSIRRRKEKKSLGCKVWARFSTTRLQRAADVAATIAEHIRGYPRNGSPRPHVVNYVDRRSQSRDSLLCVCSQESSVLLLLLLLLLGPDRPIRREG